jgi:glycosyltransferase involved in cell wall biosynthesis
MRKPMASFVIPVRNGELYLAEALDSCLLQSQRRVEVIVVDDASDDSTADLTDYFASKDDRIKVWHLKENVGRCKARNFGISKASADVLFMLDADDLALPNRVKDTLKYLKKNPSVDLVYGPYYFINELSEPIELNPMLALPFDYEVAKKHKANGIGHSTMAFTRKLAEKIRYTEEGEFSSLGIDDWKFQIDAYRAGFKFGALAQPVAGYRMLNHERKSDAIEKVKSTVLANG